MRTRFYLRYVDTGIRVLHEDGYVFAFPTVGAAADSSRDLKETYGVDTLMQAVQSDTDKLPLTDREREILEHSAGIALPGAVKVALPYMKEEEEEPVRSTKRNIRIRKKP